MRLALAALLASAPAFAGSRVVLRGEARPAGAYVALADVADATGDPLPAVWFGKTPGEGEARRVTAEDVRLELRKAGASLRSVSVEGECVVRGAEAAPAPGMDAFRAATARAIETAAGKVLPGTRLTASVLAVTGPEPDLELALVSITAVKPADGWWLGEARFHVYVNVGEAASDVWIARASVRGVRTAVVARRPLRAGHRVCSSDVTLGDVSALSDEALREVESAVGRVLSVDVAEGGGITASGLRPGALVKRGEDVTVTSRAAGATVKRLAEAMEDGRIGDVIRVKNPDSRREFSARVTAFGQVEVEE
jgi:flagella basal body P-ring formation protein FlgA